MNILKPEIIRSLTEFRDQQLGLAESYEAKQQCETAFIAYWSILENFVKTIASEYRKEVLRQSLNEWNKYLEGKTAKHPKPPPTSKLSAFNLPPKPEFHKCLRSFGFNSNQLWNVMDSEGECRKKRNRIAHSAEEFSAPEKYFDLKAPMIELVSSIYAELKREG